MMDYLIGFICIALVAFAVEYADRKFPFAGNVLVWVLCVPLVMVAWSSFVDAGFMSYTEAALWTVGASLIVFMGLRTFVFSRSGLGARQVRAVSPRRRKQKRTTRRKIAYGYGFKK